MDPVSKDCGQKTDIPIHEKKKTSPYLNTLDPLKEPIQEIFSKKRDKFTSQRSKKILTVPTSEELFISKLKIKEETSIRKMELNIDEHITCHNSPREKISINENVTIPIKESTPSPIPIKERRLMHHSLTACPTKMEIKHYKPIVSFHLPTIDINTIDLNNELNELPNITTSTKSLNTHSSNVNFLHSRLEGILRDSLHQIPSKNLKNEASNEINEAYFDIKDTQRLKSLNKKPFSNQVTQSEPIRSTEKILPQFPFSSSMGKIDSLDEISSNRNFQDLRCSGSDKNRITPLTSRNADLLKSRNKLKNLFTEEYTLEGVDEELIAARKKHSKSLNSFLKEVWANISKPRVSARIIEDQINAFVRSEVEVYFKIEGATISSYCDNETRKLNSILLVIQKQGVVLQEIFPRLKILNQLVHFYLKNKKSDLGEQLKTYLHRLTNVYADEGKEISKFLKICSELNELNKDLKSSDLVRWVQAAFGDNNPEISGVLHVLSKWNSHSAEKKIELFEDLKNKAWKVARADYLLFNFSDIEHYWFQDCNNKKSNISKITMKEIANCIKPEWMDRIIFDIFTVNNQIIWDANKFDPEEKKFDTKKLYATLFAAFSGKKKIENEHIDQSIFFYAGACESSYDDAKTNDENVPWLGLLRLTSNTNWGFADHYLRELIPGVFDLPYWTKYEPGIECHINVESENRYIVTQIKKMAICLRLDPNDANSFVPGEVQVRFNICWEVQPMEKGWLGRLWIKNISVVNQGHWNDIKQKLTTIMAVNPNKNELVGNEYLTSYPFSKKECKFLNVEGQNKPKRTRTLGSSYKDNIIQSVSTDSIHDKIIIKC